MARTKKLKLRNSWHQHQILFQVNMPLSREKITKLFIRVHRIEGDIVGVRGATGALKS